MKKQNRIRRVGITCCHCIRNIAYYLSSTGHNSLRLGTDYWITVNGNFMDIAVLEWCKLFDKQGRHSFDKVVTNKTSFLNGMCIELDISMDDLIAYFNKVREYRSKMVAHLDDDDHERGLNYPRLDTARRTVEYLYDYLWDYERLGEVTKKLPKPPLANYFDLCKEEGSQAMKSITKPTNLMTLEPRQSKTFRVIIKESEPNSGGLSHRITSLKSCAPCGTDLAYEFVFSTEFINRAVPNETYVNIMYRAFFDREPDAGGKALWLGQLDGGASREHVLEGFTHSQEFENLCKAYGISPY